MSSPPASRELQTKTLRMPARIEGYAGPASFQRRFEAGLISRGARVRYGLAGTQEEDVLLVIGATRDLPGLWRARRRGLRLVQRLDGMNWIHRHQPTGLTHFLRAEMNNLLLRIVRRQADLIIYQSDFTKDWWERVAGATSARTAVVHNGVPLAEFNPKGPERRPTDHYRLTVIEGNLAGGYQIGLDWAVQLAGGLERALGRNVELVVVGAANRKVRERYDGRVVWRGLVPPEGIPSLHRSSHLLFASDLNPACPNSVLEALACGHPVAAFETGAIPELLSEAEGAVVPYGGDPWRVEDPDVPALVRAAVPVLREQDRYRRAARRQAEQRFGLDRMVEGYLTAIGWR